MGTRYHNRGDVDGDFAIEIDLGMLVEHAVERKRPPEPRPRWSSHVIEATRRLEIIEKAAASRCRSAIRPLTWGEHSLYDPD